MSLTQVLDMAQVKEEFAANFKRPDFPKIAPPLVAPSQGKNSSLVGIAFDYLFRSVIGQKVIANRDQKSNAGALNGEFPTQTDREKQLRIIEFSPIAEIGAFVIGASKEIAPKLKRQAKRVWNAAQSAVIVQATGKEFTLTQRINFYLQLAKLDQVYRAQYIHEDFEIVDQDDVRDVLTIYQHVNFDVFEAREICLLNPPLKAAGLKIGGRSF